MGAIAGDIVGSVFEWNNVKSKDFEPLFAEHAFFTDDTVHTIAVADALMQEGQDFAERLRTYTNEYPGRGYGGMLGQWAQSASLGPYDSFGNGSAMRVSPCAWWATTEDEALALAERSAAPTHNHPEGVKGAQAVAFAIWQARTCRPTTAGERHALKDRIAAKFGYDLSQPVDDIRLWYEFDVTCQGSVPQALTCALEADGFEDALRNAISIGGDSDTIAAIAGSVAEALWGIPEDIENEAKARLDARLPSVVDRFQAMRPK